VTTPAACTPNAGVTRTAAAASFNALRDTTTDHFLATYKAGEVRR